ncbi:NAD(P)H-dependent oxidoreductase [Evansella sp. AB-P1]|uniref:NAD(P)H-dependent oxidoreductase n=1 Tax=Evansella sp. AB-P1 TaxID=3037653 RepID=UPI00241FBA19|nr:NAD(P)H-dependent oxidoreductase [Evansella sp. AB-P1]MDG5788538.1 NAD(P)H-dependent oxidoreductase [Evansella sp. AB-P1]
MKILVIIAHPSLDEDSRLNAALKDAIENKSDITINELYKEYPDEEIDVKREQQLAEEHDRIIFQFPNYWYSYPHLLKKWFDVVLEKGWAFNGVYKLEGKELGIAISSNAHPHDYRYDGQHRFTIEQIMTPIYATSSIVRTKTLPIFNTFTELVETEESLKKHGEAYVEYIRSPYTFHYKS